VSNEGNESGRVWKDASASFLGALEGGWESVADFGSKLGLTTKRKNKKGKPSKIYAELVDISDGVLASEEDNSYAVVKTMKNGVFGTVLNVRNSKSHKMYVAKEYSYDKIIDRSGNPYAVLDAIRMEVSAMRRFGDCPFILPLQSLLNLDYAKSFWLVCDYIECGDLVQVMDAIGLFNPEQTSIIVAQIVIALEHIHTGNVVHGDIKPQNILLSKSGLIKIFDFGCSYELPANEKTTRSDIPVQAGTLNYMAPELFASESDYELFQTEEVFLPEERVLEFGSAVDIWALGSTIIELLTGIPLFPLMRESAVRRTLYGLKTGTIPMSNLQSLIDFSAKSYLTKDGNKKSKKGYEAGMAYLRKNQELHDFVFSRCLVDLEHRLTAKELHSRPFIGKNVNVLRNLPPDPSLKKVEPLKRLAVVAAKTTGKK